ncbi:hypothetical protein HO173_009721 [Letharia columbiana]|uniref:Uncharacterized protein n=1 Tax=Letharia columbiana TaxID=112416 RepID=A0A8H6L1J2_9LECA|nr:uncharacterized protein HO173_009721 [Letharia columbiana]KAF6232127.1 hypothetical protein HO173_009721 [Letharia columbiana]
MRTAGMPRSEGKDSAPVDSARDARTASASVVLASKMWAAAEIGFDAAPGQPKRSVHIIDTDDPIAHLERELDAQMAQTATAAHNAHRITRLQITAFQRREDRQPRAHERRGLHKRQRLRHRHDLSCIDEGVLLEAAIARDAVVAGLRAVNGVAGFILCVYAFLATTAGMVRATWHADAGADLEGAGGWDGGAEGDDGAGELVAGDQGEGFAHGAGGVDGVGVARWNGGVGYLVSDLTRLKAIDINILGVEVVNRL